MTCGLFSPLMHFVDSPLLPTWLAQLSSIFEQMQDNLSNRFFVEEYRCRVCIHSFEIINIDQI